MTCIVQGFKTKKELRERCQELANARLIAAAPELLAALRTNLKLLESAGVVEGVAQQAARAAIAKATQLEEPK